MFFLNLSSEFKYPTLSIVKIYLHTTWNLVVFEVYEIAFHGILSSLTTFLVMGVYVGFVPYELPNTIAGERRWSYGDDECMEEWWI